ncbi:zinc-dependent alcohol dehydrogenase family protein [Undibacterium sp. TJN19]|uniref:zinc-dependent alcohol dehydrogenase family protein n=1 Tax=Undibacterium sp. TJN19 TaxID=3413055 RepID=UPI003BF0FE30
MTHTSFRTDGQGGLVRQMQHDSPLKPTQVRISVLAVGLNFRDNYFVKGNRFRPAVEGRIPCTDSVGIVTAIGSGVTRFKPGDRVNTTVLPNWIDGPLSQASLHGSIGSRERDGVLATQLQMDEQELVLAPVFLSDLEAATLSVAALTAWHAVAELQALQAGDTVVIQTTGGVAVFAIQFAHAMGAKVIVVSRSDEKLRAARQLGADNIIHTGQTPAWEQQVLAMTDGKGAQLVLDMGLSDSLRQSCTAAAFEGTVAIIGVVQEESNPLDIYTVMNKNLRVRGVETGSRAMFERMNQFLAAQRIRPVIDSVFAIADINKALDRLAASPFGKVVVNMEGLENTA